MLLAGAFNALAAGNWQRSGGKGQKPKPVTPPKRASRARVADGSHETRRSSAAPGGGFVSRRMARAIAARGAQAELPGADGGPSDTT